MRVFTVKQIMLRVLVRKEVQAAVHAHSLVFVNGWMPLQKYQTRDEHERDGGEEGELC